MAEITGADQGRPPYVPRQLAVDTGRYTIVNRSPSHSPHGHGITSSDSEAEGSMPGPRFFGISPQRSAVKPPAQGAGKDGCKPVLSGYLMKCGSRRSASWHHRWFVLSEDKLTYSRSHMARIPNVIRNYLLTNGCDLGLEATSRDTVQDDIGCAGLRCTPESIELKREPRSTATTKPKRSRRNWGGFQAHVQDSDDETDAGVVRAERGGIDKVAERCACAYSTQIRGRSRPGQHSRDAVGGSQADERRGRLAQGAGEDGRKGRVLWVPNRTLN